jgi:hypothetical protein
MNTKVNYLVYNGPLLKPRKQLDTLHNIRGYFKANFNIIFPNARRSTE